MIRVFAFGIYVCLTTLSLAQQITQRLKLPEELREISGLESFNDSILVAINDGGNSPELFFLDLTGTILKRTEVVNAQNVDWEDLATDDKGNLYIADAGNNLCNRTDQCIWKLPLDQAFLKDSVLAEKIGFTYADFSGADPEISGCRFDSEGLFWYHDSLHILTKNTTRPRKNYWDNGTSVYRIPDQPGQYNVSSANHLWTGGDNRIRHQVTACDVADHQLLVLTYSRIFSYDLPELRLSNENKVLFQRLKQREALVVLNENKWIIGAERHPLLGGPYLYILEWK